MFQTDNTINNTIVNDFNNIKYKLQKTENLDHQSRYLLEQLDLKINKYPNATNNYHKDLFKKTDLYDNFISSDKFSFHTNYRDNHMIQGLNQRERWYIHEKCNDLFKIVFTNQTVFLGNIKNGNIEGQGIYCSWDLINFIDNLLPFDIENIKIKIKNYYREKIKNNKFISEFSFCYVGLFELGQFDGKGELHSYFPGSYLVTKCSQWNRNYKHGLCTIEHNDKIIAKNERFSNGIHVKHKQKYENHKLYKEVTYDDLSPNNKLNVFINSMKEDSNLEKNNTTSINQNYLEKKMNDYEAFFKSLN